MKEETLKRGNEIREEIALHKEAMKQLEGTYSYSRPIIIVKGSALFSGGLECNRTDFVLKIIGLMNELHKSEISNLEKELEAL